MNIKLYLALLVLMLCLPFKATKLYADSSVRVHPLHLDKSYRQDYDLSVLRDPDGYLWIASDNGLKRYDGYSFRTFSHDPKDPTTIGSPNNFRVFLDAQGTLWSLGSALNRYHPETETFTRYYISDYKVMHAAANAADGGLWIGGDRLGLLLFDPASGEVRKRFLNDDDNPPSIYKIIPQRGSHRLWLSSNQGLLLFDPESGQSTTHFQLPNTQGVRPTMSLAEDLDGDLWMASLGGLYRFNPNTQAVIHYAADPETPGALPINDLTAVGSDSRNNIWVGTEKQGVFRRDPVTEKFVHYPASAYDAYRFPPASISHIYEDPEGNMWFACGHHGVVRISEHLQKFKSFQHSFDSENSLGFNHLSGLYEDSKGYIWIGTDGNGVDRFDPRDYSFKHYRHDPNDPETLGSNAVMTIAEDSRGYLWLGTWAGGLSRLDPNTGKVKRFSRDPDAAAGQTLADNHVFRIHIDAQDRLVMAVGHAGLQILDPARNHFQTFTPDAKHNPNGIRNEQSNDILPTQDGNYWLGGYQSLELFSPFTARSHVPDTGISQAIQDLHMDGNGLLWIASDGGLFRFNPASNEVFRFSRKDGLNDDFVVGVEQDGSGKLWLATRNGLTRFDPLSRLMETYDEQDGLAGAQFNRFSHLRTRKGLLYFGTNQGFSFFDPQHMPRNEYAPQLHLTGLEINHQLQHPGESPWLQQNLDLTDRLELPSNADDIRISFVAINLVAPEKNRYRHRLIGRSDVWIDVGQQRSAQYNNLPPGTYTFQLIAANNDGVWTGSTRNLTITILPAWWQTWWAFSLYVALFIGSIYGFSVWRLHLTVRRRKELEQQVNEQTTKLKDANRAISQLNSELEQRVAQRTQDLSAEVEERKQSEAKVSYIAYHDALTGLYNRAWVSQHLEQLIEQAVPNQEQPFAVLFIGGDRFRSVNETHGHQTGDRLLVRVAAIVREFCPEAAQLARLGSDEFVVVLDQVKDRAQVAKLADGLVAAFKEPISIDQLRLNFSVSLGYVVTDRSIANPAQVLRDANIAMQRAKDRGRGLSQEFDAEMLEQKLDNAALENDLKSALENGQFSVVYQPIIRLNSIATMGFEVLIRWRHPERGMVPPDRFIGMTETSGLICDIGLWVLEQACRQLQSWREAFGSAQLPVIAVNLSPVQLEREDFLEAIDQIFQNTGVDPAQIEFEITESALLRHTDTVNETLEALRHRGINLAIDDFGTGYSSLSYLDKLPVQVLKIDRSFVNALTENSKANSNANEIVRATIILAHNLGMSVVAEGIETQQQLSLLQSYGCDYGQGYFFARPMTPADATALLQNTSR
jgi:diguanylate cyclase (GGDEF)-like protein